MRLIENLSILPIEKYLYQPRSWDVFISCGSFEERCKRSSEIFQNKKVQFEISIIFNYKETDQKNKKDENIKKIKEDLENISNKVYVLNTDSVSRPSEGIKKFLEFLNEKKMICRIKK